MIRQRLPSLGACPCDQVENTCRKFCGIDDFCKNRASHGAMFGRFQNDAAARRERGRDFPDRHEEREVPRRDRAYDPERFGADSAFKPRIAYVDRGRAVGRVGLGEIGVIFEYESGIAYVPFRLGERLAVVGCLQSRNLGKAIRYALRDPAQRRGTLGCRHARPWSFVKSAPRGTHGLVDVLRLPFRDMRKDLFGCRVHGLKIAAGDRRGKGTVDIKLCDLHGLTSLTTASVRQLPGTSRPDTDTTSPDAPAYDP